MPLASGCGGFCSCEATAIFNNTQIDRWGKSQNPTSKMWENSIVFLLNISLRILQPWELLQFRMGVRGPKSMDDHSRLGNEPFMIHNHYIYIYVCVCMYVCMYACIYIYIYVYIYICVCIYIWWCIYWPWHLWFDKYIFYEYDLPWPSWMGLIHVPLNILISSHCSKLGCRCLNTQKIWRVSD